MNIENIKVAIPSSSSDGLNANHEVRFGRCAFFTIIQIKANLIHEVKVIPNDAKDATGGAGPMAVHLIAKEGVQSVLGADYGPNARNALIQSNIQMYGYPQLPNCTVKNIVDLYLKGALPTLG